MAYCEHVSQAYSSHETQQLLILTLLLPAGSEYIMAWTNVLLTVSLQLATMEHTLILDRPHEASWTLYLMSSRVNTEVCQQQHIR